MFKLTGSEKIPKSIYGLIPSTSVGKVLSLWFGFRQFNELWSCCELCAVPYSIREEGPIISVALLLSAPPSAFCMPCRQPALADPLTLAPFHLWTPLSQGRAQ